MADYDPALRQEIWCFRRKPSPNRGFNRHKRMERLGFNLVYYDNSSDAVIEPVSLDDKNPGVLDGNVDILRPGADTGNGRLIGFEFFDEHQVPFDGCQQFD